MNDNKTLKDIIIEETEKEIEANLPEFSATPEEMLAKIKAKEKASKKRCLGYIVVAAVLILAFVAIGMKYSDSLFTVDADKNGKEEIVTDDGVIIEDEGWGSSSEDGIVITDWDEIPIAKSHVEELLVPEYIPEGYEFDELTIENLDGGLTCNFLIEGETNNIEIREHINSENLQSLVINDYEEKIECEKGEIYIRKYNQYKIATIYINDGITIEVDSNLSKKEIEKLVENMD